VDDAATATLMSRLYGELRQRSMKAIALQQTQLAMVRGEIKDGNGDDLTHPYYWAAFTLIGSPW
jgi:CHAT domain-containing protein